MQEKLQKEQKTQSIDKTLEESAQAINSLKAKIAEKSKKIPRSTILVENRLSSIQEDLPKISDKMLVYRLRRVADSKMLEELSALANTATDEEEKTLGLTEARILAPSPGVETAKKRKTKNTAKRKDRTSDTEYKSSTFKCKSDLDLCMKDSRSALDKAVCYTLFIRCAIKG